MGRLGGLKKSLSNPVQTIKDNKNAILGTVVGGPVGTVVGSTYDSHGAGAQTFGDQWNDNKNAIRGAAIGGVGGAATGTLFDKNGFSQKAVKKFGQQISKFGEKVGLGSYKVDDSAFGQSSTAAQMAADAAAGQQAAANRAAVISPITYNASDEFRTQQAALANQLTNQGNGIGPSLAQSQLQAGRDANIASAMALAASQRGLTAGQGLRQVADQTTTANQLAAQEAARLRLTEQLAAREQLGAVLSGARGQDITNAQNIANAANATAVNALKQQAQNDAMVQAYMEQGLSLELAKMKAAQDLEALKSGNYNANQQRIAGFIGGLGQAGATLGAAKIMAPAAAAPAA